jgi:hypothetical protein
MLLAPLSAPGQDGGAVEITERPPTRFDLPGRGEPVYIATQRWALEPWEGEDPPSLAKIWARKPKFAVNGSRSCAVLARSYLILSMQICAVTCRNVIQGKATFWLHDLGRSGERAVRRRSLVIKELPRSTLPLVFLATPFGPFCEVFAGHQPFTADTPT